MPDGQVEEWAASKEQAKKHMEYFVEITMQCRTASPSKQAACLVAGR